MSVVRVVGVIVPIHNEEELLPACLRSIRAAAAHPELDGVPVHVVPVLDTCSDRSPHVAGPGAVIVSDRTVGMARAAGVRQALELASPVPLEQVWLAMTDADTTVPVDWLAVQLELARAGADAVAGTVRVTDWSGHLLAVPEAFALSYGQPGDGHSHMHGANLGVRASAYVAVGGFAPMAVSEDVALLTALRLAGHPTVASGRLTVTTSGRALSRTAGGFADHLRTLSTSEDAG